MANLRIIYENLVDTATSITSTPTAVSTLPVANMQNDSKVSACRVAATTLLYTLTWASNKIVGGVVIPAINLTASATIRVRLFSDTACTSSLADSGTLTACPSLDLSVWGLTSALDANAFAYGGASKTSVWFDTQLTTVKGCKIDIVDTTNPATYIDCARLVIGKYWEPSHNADFGAEFSVQDTTTSARNIAGDLISNSGTMNDTLTMSLSMMPEADRSALRTILNNVGTRRNFLVCLLPSSIPSLLEREHTIYGKRVNNAMSITGWNAYSTTLQMEGW